MEVACVDEVVVRDGEVADWVPMGVCGGSQPGGGEDGKVVKGDPAVVVEVCLATGIHTAGP